MKCSNTLIALIAVLAFQQAPAAAQKAAPRSSQHTNGTIVVPSVGPIERKNSPALLPMLGHPANLGPEIISPHDTDDTDRIKNQLSKPRLQHNPAGHTFHGEQPANTQQNTGNTKVNTDSALGGAFDSHSPRPRRRPPSAAAGARRPTIALALGGGGNRGAAHIGVLEVFERENIPIDYVIGSSLGAIVGGLYCAGVPLEEIKQCLRDGSLKKAYSPGWLAPRVVSNWFIKVGRIFKKDYPGLYSGDKLESFLEERLPVKGLNIEDLPVPFTAVATNLRDGKAYRISNGSLARAIRASSSIVPILKPVEIDDKVYADGGIRANLPASAAREAGADIVIAVLVDGPLTVQPKEYFFRVRPTIQRIADIVLNLMDEHQMQFADIVIKPDVDGVPIIARNHKAEFVDKAVRNGQLAALKAVPLIRQLLAQPPRSPQALAGKGILK